MPGFILYAQGVRTQNKITLPLPSREAQMQQKLVCNRSRGIFSSLESRRETSEPGTCERVPLSKPLTKHPGIIGAGGIEGCSRIVAKDAVLCNQYRCEGLAVFEK